MVHKVIQLEPSQRNCPLIMSHVLLSHSPHLSLPLSPPLSANLSVRLRSSFIYLFILCLCLVLRRFVRHFRKAQNLF